MKRKNKRPQNQLRRILTLLDVLSNCRMPFTLQEAVHLLEEKSGSKVRVCERTIQRDLQLLVDMDYAYIYRKHKPIGSGSKAGRLPVQYKMNLTNTANIQRAAAKARSLTAHSWHDAEQSSQQPNFPASTSEPEQHHSSDTASLQPCIAGNPE